MIINIESSLLFDTYLTIYLTSETYLNHVEGIKSKIL